MDLLVRNVLLDGEKVHVLVDNGSIQNIVKDKQNGAFEADQVIDGGNNIILPMLHNGHTHSPMVLLRGYGDDMKLDEWLTTRIWPVEARLTDEDYYWGNRLAMVEMIKSGTGFFNEMYMNPGILMRALEDIPMKAIVNYPIIDGNDENVAKAQIGGCLKFFEEETFQKGVQAGLALHSVYANSAYSLEWARDFVRDRNIPIHIHLSETEKEVLDCKSSHRGMSPVEYLDSLDFFTGNKVFGAHCVWLSDRDIDILSEHKVRAVHNPVSNMKLASGQAFPYGRLKEKSVPMVLGTDGAASNNNLDLFEEMKIASLLQKHHFRNPTCMTAEEAFSLAAGSCAPIYGTGSGLLQEGAPADFMIVSADSPSLVPMTSLLSNMVYSASGHDVKDLVCNGAVLMKDRVIEGEEEIRIRAARCAARLTGE